MLIKGPKNLPPLRNKTNHIQFVATRIDYTWTKHNPLTFPYISYWYPHQTLVANSSSVLNPRSLGHFSEFSTKIMKTIHVKLFMKLIKNSKLKKLIGFYHNLEWKYSIRLIIIIIVETRLTYKGVFCIYHYLKFADSSILLFFKTMLFASSTY